MYGWKPMLENRSGKSRFGKRRFWKTDGGKNWFSQTEFSSIGRGTRDIRENRFWKNRVWKTIWKMIAFVFSRFKFVDPCDSRCKAAKQARKGALSGQTHNCRMTCRTVMCKQQHETISIQEPSQVTCCLQLHHKKLFPCTPQHHLNFCRAVILALATPSLR